MSWPRRRHEPCAVLRDQGIPCLVWFEDAIAPYGVPTVVFDLYLLVPDIDEAARALMDKGWTHAGAINPPYYFLEGITSQRHLIPPNFISDGGSIKDSGPLPRSWKDPPGPTTTVLLPATHWNMSIEGLRICASESLVPPLPLLLDALVDSLLDSKPSTLQSRLSVYVGYLYTYCKSLKTQDFAQNLKLEHRQFHYDALSKPGRGTVPFINEQRQIRAEIREGKRQPQRNTWYLPPPEKETVARAPGWDFAFQHILGEALKKKRGVAPDVADTASVAAEEVQPAEAAPEGDVARSL